MKYIIPALLLMLFLAACGDEYTTGPSGSQAGPDIVYWSWHAQFMRMKGDGSNPVSLVRAFDDHSAFYPFAIGRGRIVYSDYSPWKLRAMDSDGTNHVWFVNENPDAKGLPVQSGPPAITRDGKLVAFMTVGALAADISRVPYGSYCLYTVDASEGGAPVLIWHVDPDTAKDPLVTPTYHSPSFSPDGRWITFVDNSSGVRAIRTDGSDVRLIGEGTGCGFYRGPAWSPDGTRIAIYAAAERGIRIYNMTSALASAAGSPSAPERTLGPMEMGAGDIAWSPDGSLIAFVPNPGRAVAAPLEIIDMQSHITTPVPDSLLIGSCDWSPDGKKLLMTAEPLGSPAGSGAWVFDIPTATVTRIATDVGEMALWVR